MADPSSHQPAESQPDLHAGIELLKRILAGIRPGMSSEEVDLARMISVLLSEARDHGSRPPEPSPPALDETSFRQLVDSSAVMLWMVDTKYRCIYANRAWQRFRGKALAPEQDARWQETIHPDDLPPLMAKFRAAASDLRACDLEFRGRRFDGAECWLLAVCQPRSGPDGAFAGFVVRSFDISERKQLEDEVARTRDAAVQATQAKSRFLANMSHEIRTPMSGVMGVAEALLDTNLDPEQAELVEMLRSSGESLLSVINDILDFSKIEAGKLGLEIVEFDLHRTVGEVVGLFSDQSRRKNIGLSIRWLPDAPARATGDPLRLRQILTNLIGNAIKFTEKGEVTVAVGCGTEAGGEKRLRFEVRDTGIGIPAEIREKLFQPFTQAETSTTRRFGGTGLGLAICKELVAMMDGDIGVEAEPGQGSLFWFSVPAHVSRESASSSMR